MIDPKKLQKLANIMVNYSIAAKKGEKILLRGYGFDSYPLIKELYKECMKVGALQVDVRFSHDELTKIFFDNANDKQLTHMTALDKKNCDSYDAMIQIVADENPYELADVDIKKINKRRKALKPLSDILHKKRWCLFYYPNLASAQTARKSLEQWENFVMDCCLIDWKKVEQTQKKFVKLMEKIKEVRVTGTETDITFGIKGQKWKTCCGKCNMPDGEIFTSPIKDKVNGVIKYNVPTQYMSKDFDWVKLTYKDGKVVNEESNANTADLTKILNTDKGSRFLGELAFGMNHKIKEGTRQILFDEKMGKSMHTALGKCYEEAPNGNDSSVHWDLIFNFGWAKAEVYFDGKKVYSKTKWVDKRFDFLNK
jgi:aminopeptidase